MKWLVGFVAVLALLIAFLTLTAPPPLADTQLPFPQTPSEAEVLAKRIRLAEGRDVYCLISPTGSMSCDWRGTAP